MIINNSLRLVCLLFIGVSLLLNSSAMAQDKKDPTAASNVIKETLSKIREVEKLDTYIAQNAQLKKDNAALKGQVASINKELAKLKAEVASQAAKIRKQLLQMPTFSVQSKILGGGRDMAILKSKDRNIRIRIGTEMSVPVSEGVWVLMQVKKISKEMIELHFPELERTVYLYD